MTDNKDDTKQVRVRLSIQLSEIAGFDPKEMVRADLKQFSNSLDDVSVYFDLNYMWIEALRKESLDSLSSEEVAALWQQTSNLKQVYSDIRSLPLSPAVDRNVVQSLSNRVREATRTLGALIFSAQPRLAVQSLEAESRRAVEALVTRAQGAVGDIERDKAAAGEVLESLRTVASEAGIAKYARIFGTEARNQGRQAWGWCGGAVLVGTAAMIYTHVLFEPYIRGLVDAEKPFSTGVIVSLAIARTIIVSLLYLAVVWCIRNFSAARHKATVNRHRQNALSTFEAFVQAAAGDQQTKNAVLLQATQAIFAPQASGYLKGEADGPAGGPMIEIVRNLAPHKSEAP